MVDLAHHEEHLVDHDAHTEHHQLTHDAWEALKLRYHKLWHKHLDHDTKEIHHSAHHWDHFKHRFDNYTRDLRVDFLKSYILILNFTRDFIWAYL